MTEGHASRVRESIGKAHDRFWSALEACDREPLRKAWLDLAQIADESIRNSERSRIEADALATELEVYRPTRSMQPPAPDLDDYEYVFTASFPWVCAAKIRKDVVWVNAGHGYHQECWLPEKVTLCGKKTAFPANERFEFGGWPRMRELCPDCLRKLDGMELLGAHDTGEAKGEAKAETDRQGRMF